MTENSKNQLLIQTAVISTIDNFEKHLKNLGTNKRYIHRVRVDIKHLRAWLHLSRLKTDKFNWKVTDKKINNASKLLSRLRDTQVIKETIKNLVEYAGNEQEQVVIKNVSTLLPSELKPAEGNWDKVKSQLSEIADTLKNDVAYNMTIKQIRKGLKRTNKKTLKLGKKAFIKPIDFIALHKLRKNVKFLYYQIEYIYHAYPEAGKKSSDALDTLGKELGYIHDLANLKHEIYMLSPKTINTEDRKIISLIIDRLIAEKQIYSERIYDTFFDASPEEFVEFIR